VSDIANYEQKLYGGWKTQTMKAIGDKREQYEMTGQLMEFDHEAGDLLRVNYSENLVTLVKDGRAIGELGFPVDDKIQKIIERAKKFYKEGVCLK
jgi:dynein heavy chain 2